MQTYSYMKSFRWLPPQLVLIVPAFVPAEFRNVWLPSQVIPPFLHRPQEDQEDPDDLQELLSLQ
jgi:hypothetical protein